MGYLTTVILYNDIHHVSRFRDDSKGDSAKLLRDMVEALDKATETVLPARGHGMLAFPSRHADCHTVFVHCGNTVTDINSYSFRELVKTNPEWARRVVEVAEGIVKHAKEQLPKAPKRVTPRKVKQK